MKKIDYYRETLKTLKDWDRFLLQESGLPGPRANIELARAVSKEGDEKLFKRYLSFNEEKAPVNSPQEFLAFCGVIGMGELLAQGKKDVLKILRFHASDPRWRVREGVAMALQRFGEVDMNGLLSEMKVWSKGNLLERRAAAAALCEPKLLHEEVQMERVFQILNAITDSLQHIDDRKSDAFKALRKGLGYCWSVAVVALPKVGKRMIERWFLSKDNDVLWVMKENLKKKRLINMDPEWVARSRSQLGM